MSLLEKSGLIFKAGETVLKQGTCKGQVPKAMEMKAKLSFFRMSHRQKVEWEDVDGEMVVTNQRTIVLSEVGRLRKEILSYELDVVGANVKSGRFGKPKLELMLNVGKPQAEKTELEVDNPEQWASVIRDAVSKRG